MKFTTSWLCACLLAALAMPVPLFAGTKPNAEPKTEKKARKADPLATHLITVTDDFVVEAYKNGVRIQDGQRKLLDEIHGATVERINVEVRPGDWLVFHLVNNHLRWGGASND
jgi:hypothetical protein